MARLRTIKPEFWTDARVGECSVSARLLFIASWNFADDYGGLDRSAKQLKAQAFPYDLVDCEPLVQELLDAGLMVEYVVDGKNYLHISNFQKHQKIERPSNPRIPLYEQSKKAHRVLPEESATTHGGIEVSSLVLEKKNCLESKNGTSASPPVWFEEFQRAYPKRAGDPNWRGALRAANARIGEGHNAGQFIAGAKRYADFLEATGKAGTEFVQQASTFLGTRKSFMLPWTKPVEAESPMDEILRLNGGGKAHEQRTFDAEPGQPAVGAPRGLLRG